MNGNPLSYEEYHPYGTTAYRSSKAEFDISLKRYRFSGKELDNETGLYYFGARYYAPWLGRWTSTDPVGFRDGPNLFVYTRNNPVTLSDPTGTDTEIDRHLYEEWNSGLEHRHRVFSHRSTIISHGVTWGLYEHSTYGRSYVAVGGPEVDEEGQLTFTMWARGPVWTEDTFRRWQQQESAGRSGEGPPGMPRLEPEPVHEPEGVTSGGDTTDTASGKGTERSFFTSSFFKGLVVGVAVTLAAVAIVATGGAALAAFAPATAAAVASSGIGTGLAVAGTVAAVANTVQSVRQRDLWNNPISQDQANFNLGFGLGSFAGGPVASGLSRVGSRAAGAFAESLGSGSGMLSPVPAGGMSIGGAVSATDVSGITVTNAVSSAGIGAGIVVLMMSGNPGDGDDGGWGEQKAKGRTFRGGGKNTRDNWYGFDRDKNFVRWWHRQGKAEFGGNDIENAAEAKEIFDHWVSIGKPVAK